MKQYIILAATLLALAGASCTHDNTPTGGSNSQELLFDPAAYNIPYASNLVWQDVYTPNATLPLSPFVLSHSVDASAGEWYGFCPSKVIDNSYTSDWEDNQWASITGGGAGGMGFGYLVCHWKDGEPTDRIPENPSIEIRRSDGAKFMPIRIWLTTTSLTYYAMKRGVPGTPGLSSSQWVRVSITGANGNELTTTKRVYIARDGGILGDPDALHNPLGYGWALEDISEIGYCDRLIFQMESNYKDAEGRMQIPPYFVIGAMSYIN